MRKREVGEDSSITRFIERVYKGTGLWFGELKTRVSNESWGLVVFENGTVTEVVA